MLEIRDLLVKRGSFFLEVGWMRVDGKVVLLGRNGSGKSTFLQTVAGFLKPVRGQIFLDGKEITNLTPSMRNIGFLPQEPVKIPLKPQQIIPYFERKFGTSAAEVMKSMGVAELFNKQAFSLGEFQISALVVLMMKKPRLLLLDEPANSLDFINKLKLWRLLLSLQTPMIYVTHDPVEASYIGDEIYMLTNNRVEGPYRNPLKHKVAEILDEFNLYEALNRESIEGKKSLGSFP